MNRTIKTVRIRRWFEFKNSIYPVFFLWEKRKKSTVPANLFHLCDNSNYVVPNTAESTTFISPSYSFSSFQLKHWRKLSQTQQRSRSRVGALPRTRFVATQTAQVPSSLAFTDDVTRWWRHPLMTSPADDVTRHGILPVVSSQKHLLKWNWNFFNFEKSREKRYFEKNKILFLK